MKKISFYLLCGIEFFGFMLILMNGDLNFRLLTFITMAAIAIIYIVCETVIIMSDISANADVICNMNENESDCVTFKDLMDIYELKKEIEDKKNE